MNSNDQPAIIGDLLLASNNKNYKIYDAYERKTLCWNTNRFCNQLKVIPKLPFGKRYFRGYDGLFVGAMCYKGNAMFFVPSQGNIRCCFGLRGVYRNEDSENVHDAWFRLKGPSVGDIFPDFDCYKNRNKYNGQIHYFLLASRQFIRASRNPGEKIFSLGGYDYNTLSSLHENFGLPELESLSYVEAQRFLTQGFGTRTRPVGEFVFVEQSDGRLQRVESSDYSWRKRYYRTGHLLNTYRAVELRYLSPPKEELEAQLGKLTRLIPSKKTSEEDRIANFLLCMPLHLQQRAYNLLMSKLSG